ncbi:MAG: DMT family transporter [Rhodobacteraceae bacterium]|nr:DMT family transporter [Paracoccaceae bacterium]
MAVGLFLFSAVDTLGKFLTDSFHAIQIVWFRHLGLVCFALILTAMRGPALFRTNRLPLQVARGCLAGCSPVLFIAAVAFVPLADAVAVTFVAPFMVTILGALVLREPVGVRRWTAVAIGFVGAMIVIRPGLGVVHPAAFLVIAAASLFALRQIISRYLSGSDKTETTVAYTAFAGALVLSLPLPFVWRTPQTAWELGLLVTMAALAACAETLVIKALEVGQSVVLAPVHYSMMIWSVFYGYVIFSDLPDFYTFLGAAIIMASGLYTLHREQVAARRGRR